MVDRKQPKGAPAKSSRDAAKREVEGQYARTDKGRRNSGIASADPRVLSGKEDGDATWPLNQGNDHG